MRGIKFRKVLSLFRTLGRLVPRFIFCPVKCSYVLSIRAMLHDPEMYQDPSAFIPERFLHKDGTLDTELAKDVELGFGFGRR